MLRDTAGSPSRPDGAVGAESFVLPHPVSQTALGGQLGRQHAIAELKRPMPLEIERRFLVTGSGWRALAGAPQPLKQGYLAASKDGVTVRMRLRADGDAWLTLKAPASGIARHEFEYSLPTTDAEALWDLAPHRLIKTRYSLALSGGEWVVDCFEGDNAPLVLAEVELETAAASIELPPWCGQEVTSDGRWSNAALAAAPISSWPEEVRCRYGIGTLQ